MHRLLEFLGKTPEFRLLLDGIAENLEQQAVYGLSGSQKAFTLAALQKKTQRPVVIITHNDDNAQELLANMQSLLPEQELQFFPALDWMPFDVLGKSKEIEAKRIKCLAALEENRQISIVTTVQAVERLFVPRDVWFGMSIQLTVGDVCDIAKLCLSLAEMGYERVEYIEGPGQYTIRGGIFDIYPLSGEALRIEFFDDELDSIRILDPLTQRSGQKVDSVKLYPAHELVAPLENKRKALPAIKGIAKRAVAKLNKVSPEAACKLGQHAERLYEKFEESVFDYGLELFTPFFYDKLDSFFEYVSREAIIVLDEPTRLKEHLEFVNRERAEEYLNLFEAGEAFVEPGMFFDFPELLESVVNHQTVLLSALPRQIPGARPKSLINFATKPVMEYVGKMADFAEEIERLTVGGCAVAILIQNLEQAERVKNTLRDYRINAPLLAGQLQAAQVGILNLGLKGGFQLTAGKLTIFTESEIIHKAKKLRSPRKSQLKGEKITPFVDLKPGDHVVHANHGIGKYLGIERLEIGGFAKDYFLIKYAGEDKLYVPSEQVNLLQKYLGGEGSLPKLYKLGGNDWAKVKSKVKAAVKDMAEDLLKLYAERDKAVGYSFSPDSVWQTEFEERFPYEETADQLQCIRDVKGDMVSSKPMDRLVCGDVGYGKTEVAIRAAFKAVMDSKQVAILVPTTILAQQHFVTFTERFAGYPMKVEMLSRFRSAKEQKKIIEGLKEGSVDVVIGTHRLVSEDVKFKDLGLLIVDEEQRFGVSHKEKLKRLKSNVDVLTLSATPIPRTLHMAMVSIRDMSVIETPPENRYPVQSYIMEYNPDVVKDAIRRELNRDGQVFYVHNKIQDLDKIVRELSALLPEARIVIAHGQMDEDRLEQIMLDFMDQKYDIMVCTTIIETGLDLPNANTLIVSDADHMGLSQLYQLKGRVGRSTRKAYAYFLYRKDKIISEVAEKRLSAIRDFTEFGSGFKIAMRDLEIRGAGNLLGGEQHGHMASVGFDMYCKLLGQAVEELKGEPQPEVVEPSIEVNVDAYIDSEYIADSATKTDFYQRLMRTRTIPGLEDIIEELIDRFGDPPQQVSNLLEIVAVRIKGIMLGVSSVAADKGIVRIKFAIDPGFTGEDLLELAQTPGPRLAFHAAEGLEIRSKLDIKQANSLLKSISGILDRIIKIADKRKPLV